MFLLITCFAEFGAVLRFPRKNLIFLKKNNMAAKRMTKGQMIADISERWGVSKKQASEMYDGLLELAYKEIKRAGEFVMPGLGKLVKKNRPARMGRNPATGATIKIPAKTVIKFTVAKAAKEALL